MTARHASSVSIAEYRKEAKRAKHATNKAIEQKAKDALAYALMQRGLPLAESEFRFMKPRRWKFDLAYVVRRIGIEIEGGTHSRGRHTRHEGFEDDAEKYNAATLLGWRVLRFTYAMIRDGRAVDTIVACYDAEI